MATALLWVSLLLILSTIDGKQSSTPLAEKQECSLEDFHIAAMDMECFTPNFTKITKHASMLPKDSVCISVCDQKFSIVFVCSDAGEWIGTKTKCEDPNAAHSHERTRRNPLIAVWAVGWGVVFAGAFIKHYISKPYPDQHIPLTITCPSIPPTTAKSGSNSASVHFAQPTVVKGSHPYNLSHIPSNFQSGSRFPPGPPTNIVYTARDNTGYSVQCALVVRVEVITCRNPIAPTNGRVDSCKANPIYAGSTCNMSCESGYTGGGIVTCQTDKSYGDTQISCKPVSCQRPPPVVKFATETPVNCPDGYVYQCHLWYTCRSGFGGSISPSKCGSDGSWSAPEGQCKDIRPPTFTSCTDILEIAPPNSDYAEVCWEAPDATDLVDSHVSVIQTGGPRPCSRISGSGTNRTIITYNATDASGNTARCSFEIRVEFLYCPPLDLTKYLVAKCPNSLQLGSECIFSCELKLQLNGSDSSTCLVSNDSSETAVWNPQPPTCQHFACTDMRPPDNGALAYDIWIHGVIAYMFCNEEYDFPVNSAPGGHYVCAINKGKWRPAGYDPPPDCIPKTKATSENLYNTSVQFYSGNCNDPATQVQIKKAFIQLLNSSLYDTLCTLYQNCSAQNVRVVCGKVKGRLKRSAFPYQATILFDLATALVRGEESSSLKVILDEATDRLLNMSNIIEERVQRGQLDLDIPGFPSEVNTESYVPGPVELVCPPGTQASPSTLTCRTCPPGFFMTAERSCQVCPVGYYQDTPGSKSCKKCPEYTSTLTSGSRDQSRCIAVCPVGHFSNTGLVPCSSCGIGTFQSNVNQTSCTKCPPTTTSFTGRTSVADCYTFDIQLKTTNHLTFNGILKSMYGQFSLTFWLGVMATATPSNGQLLNLTTSAGSIGFRVSPETLYLTIFGSALPLSGYLREGIWTHVALTWNTHTCLAKLYLDGLLVNSTALTVHACQFTLVANTSMVLGGSQYEDTADAYITRLNIWDRDLGSTDILNIASTGLANDTSAIFEWTNILKAQYTIPIRRPSSYGVNFCSASPCNGQSCTSHVDGFTCNCDEGYTGTRCQMTTDPCAHQPCLNGGVCGVNESTYDCSCSSGFRGANCNQHINPGYWTSWSAWMPCSALCGGGTTSRKRACINPQAGGVQCMGGGSMSKQCNTDVCPECTPFPAPSGTDNHCYDQDMPFGTQINCSLACQPGLMFTSDPAPCYICSAATDYIWSFGPSNNESALSSLPACTEIVPPYNFTTKTQYKYASSVCDSNSTAVNRQMEEEASDMVAEYECSPGDTCTSQVTIGNCVASYASSRNKSAHQNERVTISMVTTLNRPVLYVDGVIQIPTWKPYIENTKQTVLNMASQASYMEDMVMNGSMNTKVDGVSFNVQTNSFLQSYEIGCPPGTVTKYGVCLNCPPGEYEKAGECLPCPVGTYQIAQGQTACVACPQGMTSIVYGATSEEYCSDE